MTNLTDALSEHTNELRGVLEAMVANASFSESVRGIIDLVTKALTDGNKLLIAGNGGSAAEAQHFTGEIVGRYKRERKGYGAITLSADTSVITAWSNDYSFNTVFSRQLEALGHSGDVFIGYSTSGESVNIIKATEKAKDMGIKTVAFLGKGGGRLKDVADLTVIVPSNNTPRIQEVHQLLLHVVCEEVEKKLP